MSILGAFWLVSYPYLKNISSISLLDLSNAYINTGNSWPKPDSANMLYLGFQSQSETTSENSHSNFLASIEVSKPASQMYGIPDSEPLTRN